MPELPEVEVTRRALATHLEGGRIERLSLGKPLRWPLGIEPEALHGQRLGALQRRGKYLWLPLERDAGPGLLWHLGMSGSLRWWPSGAEAPPRGAHDHVELRTAQGALRLTDPRRFGALLWAPSQGEGRVATLLARLGAEPFDEATDAAALARGWARRDASVKAALLAGDVLVGAGNIYACEALFEAGIDPRTPASRLGPKRLARLLEAVRDVLRRGIEAGGSTLRDFQADGHAGGFQAQARVYGRAGQRCMRCGGTVRRIVQQQRSTFFCPGCQRR